MALNPKQWKCARVSSVCENLDCSSREKFSMYLSDIAIYSVFLNALWIYYSRLQDLYSKLELHPNGNSSVAMLRLAQLRHIISAEESKAESGPWSPLQWTRTNGLLRIRFRSTLSRDSYESKVGRSEDHSVAVVIAVECKTNNNIYTNSSGSREGLLFILKCKEAKCSFCFPCVSLTVLTLLVEFITTLLTEALILMYF